MDGKLPASVFAESEEAALVDWLKFRRKLIPEIDDEVADAMRGVALIFFRHGMLWGLAQAEKITANSDVSEEAVHR